jgi:maleate isomerase
VINRVPVLSPMPTVRLGFLLLDTDHGSDRELATLLPHSVQFTFARVRNYESLEPAALKSYIQESSRLILPGTALDAIGYGCTSGSFGPIGDLIDDIQFGDRPNTRWHTTRSALLGALQYISVSRIALITPYIGSLNLTLEKDFRSQGIEVVASKSLSLEFDEDIARVSGDYLVELGTDMLSRKEIECLVIACNAMPVSAVIEKLEKVSGKPVVTSNQALVWRCLRCSGFTESVDDAGRLLRS